MIKGIVALFRSGTIFNPMVLSGIFAGAYVIIHLSSEQIRDIFTNQYFYLAMVVASSLCVLFGAKVYKYGGDEIDWSANLLKIFTGCIKFIISFVLTMSFVFMFSF